METKLKEKLKELVRARNECVNCGALWALQEINHEIAKLAKKLKIDYYTI